VDIVRRALAEQRVGHLGTLDPFAKGLLVLVVDGRRGLRRSPPLGRRHTTASSGWASRRIRMT